VVVQAEAKHLPILVLFKPLQYRLVLLLLTLMQEVLKEVVPMEAPEA
jgi:hypothetical protein